MDQGDRPHQDQFASDIPPDVLGVLKANRFFELLDDRFSPINNSQEPVKCGHSFDVTKAVLAGLGMDVEDIQDVIDVLHSQGACCDCEVLYNVAEDSRLKSRHWKARARELSPEP